MQRISTLNDVNQYFTPLFAKFLTPDIRNNDDLGNSLSFVHNLLNDDIPAPGLKKEAGPGAMQSHEHDPNGRVDSHRSPARRSGSVNAYAST